MAKITTRDDLKKAIFEELGGEIHNIEITDNQFSNIFDKALKKMYENDLSASTDRSVAIQLVSDWDKANIVFATKVENLILKKLVESMEVKIKELEHIIKFEIYPFEEPYSLKKGKTSIQLLGKKIDQIIADGKVLPIHLGRMTDLIHLQMALDEDKIVTVRYYNKGIKPVDMDLTGIKKGDAIVWDDTRGMFVKATPFKTVGGAIDSADFMRKSTYDIDKDGVVDGVNEVDGGGF